jgi:alpha/beta superfamily hydrolase
MPTPRTENAPDLRPDAGTTAVIEQIGYWPADDGSDEPLHVALHLPARPVGAAVIVGSIGWEFHKNYRREVLLARRLAEQGLAVARFHYRGLGESGGEPGSTTLDSMTADARRVRDLLRHRTGLPSVALVGIRAGALVAAAVAGQCEPVPVVLWDPVVAGADYVRELTRIQRVWQVTRAASGSSTQAADDGTPGAALNVLGFRLSADLLAQLREARLGPWLESSACAVLSMHVGGASRHAAPAAPAPRGPHRATETVPGRIDWWMKRLSFEPEESSPVTRALIARTAQWLTPAGPRTDAEPDPAGGRAREPGPAQTGTTATMSATALVGGVPREAVRVNAGGDLLAGFLTGPTAPDAGLAAVILNCGGYHVTSGPGGLWTLLADKLAALGVPSLRLSYRGVAESTGTVTDFDLTRPRTEELRAARARLAELGYARHVLLGGCLGARTCCAADLEGVAGLGLVSLPVHREALAAVSDSRKTAAGGDGPDAWLNTALLDDLGRCVASGVPLRIVYSEHEPYRRDLLRAAEETGAGAGLLGRGRGRLGLTLIPGPDSMVEPHAVSDELAGFVGRLVAPRG